MLQRKAAAKKGSTVNWQFHLRLTWKQTPSKSSSLLQHLTRPVLTIRLHKLKERPFVNAFQLRKRFYFNRMDCDQFRDVDTRVCNTVISLYSRQGIHLTVEDPNVKLCCTQQHFHHRLTSVVYKNYGNSRATIFCSYWQDEMRNIEKITTIYIYMIERMFKNSGKASCPMGDRNRDT